MCFASKPEQTDALYKIYSPLPVFAPFNRKRDKSEQVRLVSAKVECQTIHHVEGVASQGGVSHDNDSDVTP